MFSSFGGQVFRVLDFDQFARIRYRYPPPIVHINDDGRPLYAVPHLVQQIIKRIGDRRRIRRRLLDNRSEERDR